MSFLPWMRVLLFGGGSRRAMLLFRTGQALFVRGYPALGRLFFLRLERDYACYLHPDAQLAPNVCLKHPAGIVIGSGAQVDEDVTVYQQVTLGGARIGDQTANAYPHICAGAVVFAGAKVLGNVRVGCNSVVGANAVVIHDVPDNHIAVGVPARNHPKKIP